MPNIQTEAQVKSIHPIFRAGDTISVHYKIKEGNKERIQPYEGIVIALKGKGVTRTATVRKLGSDNVGIERIFPLFSPNIEKIDVVRVGKVRRAKLYYLRDMVGRKAYKIRDLKNVKEGRSGHKTIPEPKEMVSETALS